MNALLYIIKLLYIMHLPDLEEKGFYMRVRAIERERERQSFGSANGGSHRIHIGVQTLSQAREWNLRT